VIRIRGAVLVAAAAVLGLFGSPASVVACSPPFNPTIAELGPSQVVLVGTTGAAADGGRLFHVERVYNGPITTTPIVIAFKEGEPVGDCSYPVSPGQHMIIAPVSDPDGRLSADLGTLQAEVTSETGLRYVDEARSLFGTGTVPAPVDAAVTGTDDSGLILLISGVALLATLVTVGVLVARGRSAA
jgi:hypothetical protein